MSCIKKPLQVMQGFKCFKIAYGLVTSKVNINGVAIQFHMAYLQHSFQLPLNQGLHPKKHHMQ